jgi:glycosyltransferase involved in cell wall biosynthesis
MNANRRAPFSVLLPTHAEERPERLELALNSIGDQTLAPSEVVVVIDGPVEAAQTLVIERFADRYPWLPVRRVILDRNRGLAHALNAGLEYCRLPFVARMDSDDVAFADRVQLQWEMLQAQPELDLLSGWQAEFSTTPSEIIRIKTIPPDHDAIANMLVWRCSISHPTIVFKRAVVQAIGGYRAIPYLEDYDLYLRLLAAGARFGAVQSPLVRVRVTREQLRRRGGLRHLRSEWRFRWDAYRRGNLTIVQLGLTLAAYSVFRMLPDRLRAASYRFVRRRPTHTTP